MAGEAGGHDLAARDGDLTAASELDDATSVRRVVERAPHTLVVEWPPADVEEHVLADRGRDAVQLSGRADSSNCPMRLGAGVEARMGRRRSRDLRPPRSTAAIWPSSVRGERTADFHAIGEAGRAGLRRGQLEVPVADQHALPARAPQAANRYGPVPGGASSPVGRIGVSAGTTYANGIASLCRNSTSGRVRWIVIVRALRVRLDARWRDRSGQGGRRTARLRRCRGRTAGRCHA